MRKKPSRVEQMHAAENIRTEMMEAVRTVGFRLAPRDSVKARRQAVSRAAKLSAAMVDRLWYGNITRVDATVADTLRLLAKSHETIERAQNTVFDVHSEITEIKARLDHLIALLGKENNGQGLRGTSQKADRSIGGTSPVGWIGRAS